MCLSKRSLETLLDLVEIKLSCMEVWDRDDRRELQNLEQARSELRSLAGEGGGEVLPMPRRRGRPRNSDAAVRRAAAC